MVLYWVELSGDVLPGNINKRKTSLTQLVAYGIKRKYNKLRLRKTFLNKVPANQINKMGEAEVLDRIERQLTEAQKENDIRRYISLAPKHFSGHLQEDFPVFLDRLNLYFGSMNLTDEQNLAKFPLCFSSQAFIDYNTMYRGILQFKFILEKNVNSSSYK